MNWQVPFGRRQSRALGRNGCAASSRRPLEASSSLDIQRDRKQRIQAEQTAAKRRAEAAERDARNSDPATKARNKANLEAARALIHS
jgi:hypothetical protein